MRFVLVGNYGVGNVGDEALKEYFLSAFRDVRWTVVSARPTHDQDVPRLPMGIRSFFSPWFETIGAIKHADGLVFGGGSLFTDTESVWACVMWYAYTVVAGWYKKPVFLAFQGAGPWKTALGRSLSRRVYESAEFISVRDEKSLERLKAWTLRSKPVLTFDPAFALFAEHSRRTPALRTLAIIPRMNSDEAFFRAVEDAAKRGFDAVHILLMQPNQERRVGERIKKLSPGSDVIEISSPEHLLEEVAGASEVLTQRYHGALAALALHVPFSAAAQSKGDKLDVIQSLARGAPDLQAQYLSLIQNGSDGLRQAFQSVSSL